MMQKPLLLTLVCIAFFYTTLFSQTLFQKSYQHAFFEQAVAVETLAGGHHVLAGYTANAAGGKDIWVMRVNSAGDKLWSKIYALSQPSTASAVQKTTDGNLLITYNAGTTPATTTSGWLKIAANGDVIWSKKSIGSSVLTNISPSAGGGYLLSGQNITAVSGQQTGLVVHIQEDGSILWSTVFGENGSSAVTDCWEDALGFIYCCGYTTEAGGDRNGFWAKLGADGELVGPVRRYGSADEDALTRIVPMGTDRLLLSGYTRGFANSAYSRVWTVVTDYFGVLKFSKTFALSEQSLVTNDLIALPGDQYLLALGNSGGQLSPAVLMKLSVDLDQLFAVQYKGGSESDIFAQVIRTNAGFAATGSSSKNGDADMYFVVTDIDGKLNNDDCCPLPLELTRQDVSPETLSFVPTQTAFYAVQNVFFTVEEIPVVAQNLCQQIELNFSLSQDTICPGECVDITSADSTAGVVYSFDYQGGIENVDEPGQVCHTDGPVLFITRKGTNNTCETSLTRRVVLGSKKDEFPNAFTPNGDGANDVFKPVFGCPAVTMHFQIFDRWGKRVFETTDPAAGWEGKIEASDAASDVYVWKLEYEMEINGSRVKMLEKGEVTLLR